MPLIVNPNGSEQLIIPSAPRSGLSSMGSTPGDLAFDTTTKTMRVDDGVTPGGRAVLLADATAALQGFFGSAFRGDNDQQFVDHWIIKPSGETAIRLNNSPVDAPGEARDPATIKGEDGYWYEFMTTGFSSASFRIRRSVQKNLVSGFADYRTVDCSAGGTIRLAWAPSPYRDPTTGKWYAEVALAPTSDPTTHYMAAIEFNAADFSSWKAPVNMGMGFNYIDGTSVYSRGKHYHVAKHEETQPAGKFKYVEIWRTTTYPTGWTKITNGDFLAIPYDVEGATPVEDANGICHIFLDANASGFAYHTSASSFEGTWTTAKQIDKGGLPLRHGFFINITDQNRDDIQEAVDFYGADLDSRGPATYIQQDTTRRAQAASVALDGPPIGGAMQRYSAPGNYSGMSLGGGPQSDFERVRFWMDGAGALYIQMCDDSGTWRNSAKFVWRTGLMDAPTEFEPRDYFDLTLQNGWAVQDGLKPKAYRDRMGRVEISGCITKSGTPAQNEVIATLPGGFAPARVDMWPCTANDGLSATPGLNTANLAVANGALIWISGGKTKIYLSPIVYRGAGSATNV